MSVRIGRGPALGKSPDGISGPYPGGGNRAERSKKKLQTQFPLAWGGGISIFEILRRSRAILYDRSRHYPDKIFLIPLVKNFTSLYSFQTRL
jgi:hypothetical protein